MAETDKDDLIGIIEEDDEAVKLPTLLPLMPVRDVVIFTDMLLPLFVGRSRSVQALEAAVSGGGYILLCAQKDPQVEDPSADDIYRTGTVSRVLRVIKMPDGQMKALVQGLSRARIQRYTRKRSFFRVRVDLVAEPDVEEVTVEVEAMMRTAREHSEKILSLKGEMTSEIGGILDSIQEPGRLADLISSNLRMKINEAQQLLEIVDPVKRLAKVNELLLREVELSSIQAKIQSNVKSEITKNQRDYFLREQMRAIHQELGELDDKTREVIEYKKKIKKAKMPARAREEARRQLKRLDQMHPESAESTVVRTYLDWLVELPWKRSSKGKIDIPRAKKVLDANHYGLEKVKDRILEYLAVRQLNPRLKGAILCFVGPPGVGKTSLGRAVAKAMKRKFVRISLGGIRDEAEIRGHRRTYIGAMPGRILQGLKQCGTNNPVFMMDEIDKLGSDFRGDPSSALLEALDPEQNFAFSDHYLNLPFNLSNVMFILTANMTDTIPSALLDRMEVINLPGYTEDEKRVIASRFLLPRQIRENGLKKRQLVIKDRVLTEVVRSYTSEAGLRNLERELGTVCRKVARKIAESQNGPFKITLRNLEKYLGVQKFFPEMDETESQVGLAAGLAWTPSGGEILYIEATLIGGKGDLIVTGQLGEVMQESARAALSYVRANHGRFGIAKNVLDNADIHIHVPAGAIPKDGPSAGISMATALISAFSGKPVNHKIAMTGEVTLRGRVLPIGGIREKAMGALRAGIRTILLPEMNKRELSEVPPNIRRKIKFIPVRTMDDVVPLVIPGLKRKK
ncbi:MAG: endopeptidase La [Deltaproteobacteria bacterium]|nr:MAG: endopeptidase La [Deltaproteobacteria bacterium]